jgi:hypothetical protein
VGVALAWQLAFIVIARDPARFRPLMIPSIFEKLNYAIAVCARLARASTQAGAGIRGVDPLLGILFAISYFKTKAPALSSTDR